jgi:hypothetical protein
LIKDAVLPGVLSRVSTRTIRVVETSYIDLSVKRREVKRREVEPRPDALAPAS